jgi:PAS domain S-box-containing protein
MKLLRQNMLFKKSKTNKARFDLKGIDASILGRIMAAQNILFVLPTKKNIAEFYAKSLHSLPGVNSCKVCFGDSFSQEGNFETLPCNTCKINGPKNEESASFSKNAMCKLGEMPNYYVFTLDTLDYRFGFFIFNVNHPESFELYKPFISNLGNFVALSLENRVQKKDLQNKRDILENKVKERTKELQSINAILEEKIEEHKLTENALQQSEEQFKFLFGTMAQGIIIQDAESKIIEANDAACDILGLSRAQILGKTAYDPRWKLIHGDGSPLFPEEMPSNIALATCKPVKDVLIGAYVPEKDTINWILTSSTPKFNNGNSKPYLTMTTFTNISEQKQVEEALRKSEAELKEAQKTAHIGSWDWDAGTDTFKWSEEYYRIYGFDPSQREPGLKEHLKAYAPGSAALLDEAVKRNLQTGQPYQIDLELANTTGTTRWITMRSETKRDANGKIIGLRGTAQDITERKKNEEALFESQQVFRTLVENSPDIIARYDRQCKRIYVNPVYIKESEIPQKELITTSPLQKSPLPPDSAVILQNLLLKVSESGVPDYADILWPKKDNIDHWYNVYATPEFDKEGRVISVMTISRDITARKQVEQERLTHLRFFECMDQINRAIQRTNDLTQMMHEALKTVLQVFDCDRVWLFYPCDPDSPTFRVPMEITKPEYPGAGILNVDLPLSLDMAQNLRDALESSNPVTYTVGTEKPINKVTDEQFGVKSQVMTALYPRTGKPWVFGLHQCSYPRVWTFEEKRLFQEIGRRIADGMSSLLAYRDLQESEQRYRMVFENSPVSIWEEDFSEVKKLFNGLKKQGITNIENYFSQHPEVIQQCASLIKIVDVNQSSLTLHAAKNKQELLTNLVNTFTPESFDTFRKELVCLWNGGTEIASDATVKTLAGEQRYVTVYFSVCPGYEETLSKVLVSLIDITKRKQAEAEVYKLNQELEKRVIERTTQLELANKELEAFAYSVSHDLRAPLRGIDGFSQVLLEEYHNNIDDQGKDYLHRIRNAAQRMGQLIDDILSLSRVSRSEMIIQEVNLSILAKKIAHNLQETQPSRKVKFIIHHNITTMGDDRLLRIALENLLGNAWKFTSKHPKAHIEFGIQQQNEQLVYFVRDDGAGFDMNYVQKLFGAFQRLHTTHEFPGTGIGLATVQRIIHRHGGNIWAEGEQEKGSTFYFTISLNTN